MPHDIDHNTAAQRRTSKLLAAMAIFICLGIVAYIILTLLVNRQTPATPTPTTPAPTEFRCITTAASGRSAR